jgi:hypothetical protein
MDWQPDIDRSAGIRVLKSALDGVPGMQYMPGSPTDADIGFSRAGCPTIRVRMRPWAAGETLNEDEVWLLRSASPEKQRQLRERGEDFIALNGAVRLVRDWLVVDRMDLPPERSAVAAPPRVDPFSDRNSLISRTLLANTGRSWRVRELAAAAGVAVGTASQVVRALAAMGAVDSAKQGRTACVRVTNAALLLTRWLAAYSWDRNAAIAFDAPMGDVSRFVGRLPKLFSDTRWALTMHAGAAQVAAHATWDRVHLYVDVPNVPELARTGAAHGWKHAADGRVVLMKPYYRTSVWHDLEVAGTLPVVSTLQLALDLWHYPLRGREQAQHLLTSVLDLDV